MRNFSHRYQISITREMRPGYYVEIQFDRKKKDLVEFWLWNENIGIKEMMFGVYMEDYREKYAKITPYEREKSPNIIPYLINTLVENNIDEYIRTYKEDYEIDKI